MGKKKAIIYGLLFLLGIFIFMGLSSAATTIVAPAASGAAGECSAGLTTLFNVSITDGTVDDREAVNLTFYLQSASTANSSWVSIGSNNSLNLTAADANISLTSFNLTTVIEDANDYIINVTVNNDTTGDILGSDTNTGVRIDCTTPATPSALSPAASATETDGDVTFSATVTGSQTTACTLFFDGQNPGATSYTMTHSGNTCTRDLTSIPEQTYSYYIRATDGSNTTDSATTRFRIDGTTSAGRAAMLAAEGYQTAGGALVVLPVVGEVSSSQIVIGLLIVGGVIFLTRRNKKK